MENIKRNSKNKKIILFLTVLTLIISAGYLRTITIIPGEVTLLEGEEYEYNFKSPFLVNISSDRDGVVKLNNDNIKASGSFYRMSDPIKFKPQKNGKVNLNLKLFGLLPLPTIHVDVVPNKKIVACGNTVGVKLKIDGILVIGMSDVETTDGKTLVPARDGGLRPGDLIKEVNDKKLANIDDLIRKIDLSNGEPIKVRYKRGSVYSEAIIKPVKALDDKKFHIGLWVRDNSAGIGTLTFYDPESNWFGALGHGITDIDTGSLIPIDSGEILKSSILAVKKGRQGNPGELKGVFLDEFKLGEIRNNSECGIYGVLNGDTIKKLPKKQYPIAMRSQVKEGPATILANIDGESVEEYGVEIQRVLKQNSSSSKGMIIKITDKRLLDTTGGIVQGMSGSPILQNNHVVGAITHVLVNNPTQGYGMYIEWMLKSMNTSIDKPLSKAG